MIEGGYIVFVYLPYEHRRVGIEILLDEAFLIMTTAVIPPDIKKLQLSDTHTVKYSIVGGGSSLIKTTHQRNNIILDI